MISILLVDDHSIMRMGLGTLLAAESEFLLVAEAENAAQAVEAFAEFQPDVTLLDVRLPGVSGLDVLKQIRAASPAARIIMFTSSEQHGIIASAIALGAAGYVPKSARFSELAEAIRQVQAGNQYFPENISRIMASHSDDKRLSPREIELLEHLRRGLTNREIALAMEITEATVKFHLGKILVKMGVADRTEAVAAAYDRGLLEVRND